MIKKTTLKNMIDIKVRVILKAEENKIKDRKRHKDNYDNKYQRGKGRQDGNNGNRQNNFYFQKGEQQQQQHQLVSKRIEQKRSKQAIQENIMNQNDFPSLGALQN